MITNLTIFAMCLVPGIAMAIYLMAQDRSRRHRPAQRPRPAPPAPRANRQADHGSSSPVDTYVASSSFSSSDASSCSDGGGCGGGGD